MKGTDTMYGEDFVQLGIILLVIAAALGAVDLCIALVRRRGLKKRLDEEYGEK